MIAPNQTATRVKGGWAYYDESGQQVGVTTDWRKMTVQYKRTTGDLFKVSTMIDTLEKPIPALRKAKQR